MTTDIVLASAQFYVVSMSTIEDGNFSYDLYYKKGKTLFPDCFHMVFFLHIYTADASTVKSEDHLRGNAFFFFFKW